MTEVSTETPAFRPPLVVDLDGTLTPSDTLVECLMQLVRLQPQALPSLLLTLFAGRAAVKHRVAQLTSISAERLPWRLDLLEFLRAERAAGRRVVLATAAHQSIADAVARHLNVFDDVLSTTGANNLKGEAKLAAIRERVGGRFVYVGDSSADVPIWNGSSGAILVGGGVGLRSLVEVPIEREFVDATPRTAAWLKAMRPHQWVKNVLVFVPLLTSFAFNDIGKLFSGLIGFLAFCLAASATYILNDIWDVERDRQHPRKQHRPFASGSLQMHHGLVAALALFAAAATTALGVSPLFLALLGGYAVITTAYSWLLKTYILLDVLTLAVLYTWRVLAGSVAVSVATSTWLLAFSVFLFFSLALVKRCSELLTMQAAGRSTTAGRDYSVRDLVVLWPLGIGAGLSAVVVFGLYIGSTEAAGLYASPAGLWLVGLALLYWLSRLWIKTARGEMHDDPVVFALKDGGSRKLVGLMVLLAIAAHFIPSR